MDGMDCSQGDLQPGGFCLVESGHARPAGKQHLAVRNRRDHQLARVNPIRVRVVTMLVVGLFAQF